MATLIAGRLALFNSISIEDYLPGEKIVVAGMNMASVRGMRRGLRTTYTDISTSSPSFDSLFEIHDFDNVIYLSDLLDPLTTPEGENRAIYHILENCSRRKIRRVILCLPIAALEKGDTKRAALFDELSTTIHFFRDFLSVELQCLYVPYILNADDHTNFTYRLATGEKSESDLPWKKGESPRFIDISTFADFFRHFFADDSPGDREMYIDPDFVVNVDDDLMDNPELSGYHPAPVKHRFSFLRPGADDSPGRILARKAAGVAALFLGAVGAEFVTELFSGYAVFQSIDFRMIYIIFAALLGGFTTGTLTAVFECIMLIYSYSRRDISFLMTFYSVDHLIPLLFYLFLGTAIGYRQDRSERLVEFSEGERDGALDQNRVLSGLYSQAIRKKTEYRNDLLNSRNGYGKIFAAVN